MGKRALGFGKPRWKRAEPREIGASSAAPEPSGPPEPIFRDHSEPASEWQSRPAGVTVQSWWGELGELGLRVAGFGGGGYVI